MDQWGEMDRLGLVNGFCVLMLNKFVPHAAGHLRLAIRVIRVRVIKVTVLGYSIRLQYLFSRVVTIT